MDPRIKDRLSQAEQEDPLDERVRAYLMERMNAAPEAAPDYSRERQLDVIGNAGTNISNIFLNRAGLGQMKAGEGFEAAARRDAVRPKETRDELASGLYSSALRERLAGKESARHAQDSEFRAQQAAQEAEFKKAQEARRAGESDRDYEARMIALRQSADQFERKLAQDKALGYAGITSKQKTDEAGKTMPASTVGDLSSLNVAEQLVDKAVDEFNRLGMGGAMGRISGGVTETLGLRNTDAAEYDAAARIAMQAAGTILEGGKLAAGDEVKYRAMLPRPGDSQNVVEQKRNGMKAYLRSVQSANAKGLKDSGYNVPASLMGGNAVPAPVAAAQQQAAAGSRKIAVNKKTGERRYVNADGSLGEVVK